MTERHTERGVRGRGHRNTACALGRPGHDDKGSTGMRLGPSDRHTLATTTNALIVSSVPGRLIKG